MGDIIADVELHPGEELPLQANFEDVLGTGETVASATVVALDAVGDDVSAGLLSGAAMIVTPRVQQRVLVGTGIEIDQNYMVVITATTSAGLDYAQRFRVAIAPLVELAPDVIADGGGPEDNSYVTIDEAFAYFETRLDASAWDAATQRRRAQALIAATRDIEALRFKGELADITFDTATPSRRAQALAFPRSYTIDGNGDLVVPPEVKRATCEQALALLVGGTGASRRQRLQAQGVAAFSVEGMSETYRAGAGSGGFRAWDRLCPDAQHALARHVDWSVAVGRA